MASATAKARKEALSRKKKFENNRASKQKINESKTNILRYTNDIYVTNLDTIKLQNSITQYEKIKAKRVQLYNAKYKEYLTSDGYISESENNDLLDNPNYGIGRDANSGTSAFETAIARFKNSIKKNEETIVSYQKKISELQKSLPGLQTSVQPPKPTNTNGASATDQGNATFSTDWKYNAPMVKSAYFNSAKGLSESLVGINNDGNFIDAGKYQDALKAWTNTTGGRGTLQMDRKFVKTIADSQNNTVALDPQMYGFKFLYNPKEVGMSWNQLMAMDPFYESSGQDPYTTVSAQLVASTVELTLLLNRVGDFAYINENGFNSGFGNVDQAYAKFLQDDLRQGGTITNPYPDFVDLDDIKEIYKKGTMYDLEYLFKTINGPHATFTSLLNGKTADRGWIRPTFVELHLGAGMRYRVRVIELSVTHSIFNSRMVPILSSVKLVLGRFNDGPQNYSASDAGVSYSTSTGFSYNPNAQPGGAR
jgi:hypothetical protein